MKGNTFSTIAIKDILVNPIYTSMLRYNRHEDWETKRRKGYNPNYILVQSTHELIIDKETFGKVEERIKMESKQPQWTHGGENILTGLLRCPECGGPMAASNTTNKLKDGTKKRIRYYSCANFRNKGATVCHANSIRADVAESFVLDRVREVIAFPDNLNKIIDELNQQIQSQRKPWELERQTLEKELVETQAKIDRWHTLLKDTPELSSELGTRIEHLEIEYYTHKQRIKELNCILEVEGYNIKKADSQKVLELVDALIEDSDSKKTTKAILKTFVDRITFDKESKSDFKIYMTFDQLVIDRLNEFMSSEPTAETNAVGSFHLHHPVSLVI
jgi:site-specific DNA recombinase